MDSCRSKQKYPLLGGVHYSACLILSSFTVHNKNSCKIVIWNKLTSHIAQNTACQNIEV